jgi:hypothetical protein
VIVGAGAATALGACILADPAPTLTSFPTGPPTILAGATPSGPLISVWPDEFVLPIEVVNPSENLQWIGLVYPGSTPPPNLQIDPDGRPVAFSIGPDAGNVALLSAHLNRPPATTGCFTVQVIVAYAFNATQPVPLSVGDAGGITSGGAVATWLFAADGNLEGCAAYDAGSLADGTFPDASPPDAPVDGGSG